MQALEIRRATPEDFAGVWDIFHRTVMSGETYSFAPDTTREEARALWMEAPLATYVAISGGEVVGTYYLRPNQPGLGNHVCNAGYMVRSAWKRRGTGRRLGEHSLVEAKQLGFAAMQFNFVVSTNTPAIRLWESLGFSVVGRIPKGFRHARHGFVDVLVMYRSLED